MAVKLSEKELSKVAGGSVASDLVHQAKEQQKNNTNNNTNGSNVIIVDKGKDNATNSNTGIINGSQNNNTVDIS